jgi:hypothetical protein
MNIDYSKLNERIVKQAYGTLDKIAVAQLIQDKFERACALSESQEAFARRAKYPKHYKVD